MKTASLTHSNLPSLSSRVPSKYQHNPMLSRFVLTDQVHILHSSSTTLWKDRITIDLIVADHHGCNCLEVIFYNPDHDEECRLYLIKDLLASKFNLPDLGQRIADIKEVSLRRRDDFDYDAVTWDVLHDCMLQYINSRIVVVSQSQPFQIQLKANYGDVTKPCNQGTIQLDVLYETLPDELQPLSTKQRRRVSSVEISGLLASLQQERSSIAQLTLAAHGLAANPHLSPILKQQQQGSGRFFFPAAKAGQGQGQGRHLLYAANATSAASRPQHRAQPASTSFTRQLSCSSIDDNVILESTGSKSLLLRGRGAGGAAAAAGSAMVAAAELTSRKKRAEISLQPEGEEEDDSRPSPLLLSPAAIPIQRSCSAGSHGQLPLLEHNSHIPGLTLLSRHGSSRQLTMQQPTLEQPEHLQLLTSHEMVHHICAGTLHMLDPDYRPPSPEEREEDKERKKRRESLFAETAASKQRSKAIDKEKGNKLRRASFDGLAAAAVSAIVAPAITDPSLAEQPKPDLAAMAARTLTLARTGPTAVPAAVRYRRGSLITPAVTATAAISSPAFSSAPPPTLLAALGTKSNSTGSNTSCTSNSSGKMPAVSSAALPTSTVMAKKPIRRRSFDNAQHQQTTATAVAAGPLASTSSKPAMMAATMTRQRSAVRPSTAATATSSTSSSSLQMRFDALHEIARAYRIASMDSLDAQDSKEQQPQPLREQQLFQGVEGEEEEEGETRQEKEEEKEAASTVTVQGYSALNVLLVQRMINGHDDELANDNGMKKKANRRLSMTIATEEGNGGF